MASPNDRQRLRDFVTQHGTPYDPATDDYDRPPFAEDTKEGKNDPIYNVHSYHTKVPPRSVIPFILHYTQPNDLIVDPFCGSGMVGVAAQMCSDPPKDLLDSFPALEGRVGPRACVLSDLSPAACHIAYNYCTPIDVEALLREFERIKTSTKDEFHWLYGTEHYEPAVGTYEPRNVAVAGRLTNGDASGLGRSLLDDQQRTWTLLTKAEVEERLGYPVGDLKPQKAWGDLDLAAVERWIAIPAVVEYSIWSDVYRCEGFVTIETPTGTLSTRGKNKGNPITVKKRAQRGCGQEIVIWNAAVNAAGEVSETFKCPHCSTEWKKRQIPRQGTIPVIVSLSAQGLRSTPKGPVHADIRYERPLSARERATVTEIESRPIPYWVPDTEMDTHGPRYRRDALQVRKIKRVTDFWTPRNLWAYASLWNKTTQVVDVRVGEALRFALTGITFYVTRKQAWGTGGGGLSGQLFISSFTLEKNVWAVWERKIRQLVDGYRTGRRLGTSQVVVSVASATTLSLPDQSVDYVFTDPPFGSNIYYSEPNLLWEAWLGRITDASEEAVVHRKTDGGTKRLSDYAHAMHAAFSELFRVLKPNRWCTVEFNNSDGAVFEVIKQSIRQAGFEIVNMLLFDKEQKTFQQVKGAGLGVVDKDVLFNLHKPAIVTTEVRTEDLDLEQQVVDAVRQHLLTLPERIKADPSKYNDEHRTTATINSMLMNALIPRGVSVERLNLPFIERVCGRYFRRVGQHWYLRGEAVGREAGDRLFAQGLAVTDELTAIAWLRHQLQVRPMLLGEIKPLWMRATGLLAAEVSQSLILEDLLTENFWRDSDTTRWREPTTEERERMNDDRSLRVLHDAERFVNNSLRRDTTDEERCDWIDVLFRACRAVEDNETDALPALRGFDRMVAYGLLPRLFQSVLADRVSKDAYTRAEKQARAASQRIARLTEDSLTDKDKGRLNADQTILDFGNES